MFEPVVCYVSAPLRTNTCDPHNYGKIDTTPWIVFHQTPDNLLPTYRQQFDYQLAQYLTYVEQLQATVPPGTPIGSWDPYKGRTIAAPTTQPLIEHLSLQTAKQCSRIICSTDVSATPDPGVWLMEFYYDQSLYLTTTTNQPVATAIGFKSGGRPMVSIRSNGGDWFFNPGVPDEAQGSWESESCEPIDNEITVLKIPTNGSSSPFDWNLNAPGDCLATLQGGLFIARFGVLYAGDAAAHHLDPALPRLP